MMTSAPRSASICPAQGPARRYETEMLGRRYRAIDLPWPVAELSIRTIGLPPATGSAYGARARRPLSYLGAATAVFANADAGVTFGRALVLKKEPTEEET